MGLLSKFYDFIDMKHQYKLVRISLEATNKINISSNLLNYYSDLIYTIQDISSDVWVLESSKRKGAYLRRVYTTQEYKKLLYKSLPEEFWLVSLEEQHYRLNRLNYASEGKKEIRSMKKEIMLHAHHRDTGQVMRFIYSHENPDILKVL